MLVACQAILILKNVRANTRFAPTSNADLRAIVGANLVFARSRNTKMRIAGPPGKDVDRNGTLEYYWF